VVARGRTDDWDDGEVIITSPAILRNQNYEVRARWVPASDRATAWCAWEAATVPDVGEGAFIANESITTPKLAHDAVISKYSFSGSNELDTSDSPPLDIGTTASIDVATSSNINNPNPSPVFIEFSYDVTAKIVNFGVYKAGQVSSALVFKREGASKNLASVKAIAKLDRKNRKQVIKSGSEFFYDFSPPAGPSKYKMIAEYSFQPSTGGGDYAYVKASGTAKMVWWKR
jgi:hypothetical protein